MCCSNSLCCCYKKDVYGPYHSRSSERPKLRPGETFQPIIKESDSEFRDRVHKFVRTIMGSKDLYCCPLCYTVSYNSIGQQTTEKKTKKNGKKSRPSVEERYKHEFDLDPISILTEETLDVASAFCFNSAAKVKNHLREDHGIDKKNISSVSGNELFKRFQVSQSAAAAAALCESSSSFDFGD